MVAIAVFIQHSSSVFGIHTCNYALVESTSEKFRFLRIGINEANLTPPI